MMTFPELAADALEKFLGTYMRRRFGSTQTPSSSSSPAAARVALECIGNSDALYHNVEHTFAGHAGGATTSCAAARCIPSSAPTTMPISSWPASPTTSAMCAAC